MPKHVPILEYHSILGDNASTFPPLWSARHTVTHSDLCVQLDLLKEDGWRSISPADIHAVAREDATKYLVFTFDDGIQSDTLAASELVARGFGAIFYVTWSNLGQPGYLDGRSVRALAAQGLRIGSHGFTHTRFTDKTEDELHLELAESKMRLEDLIGAPVTDLALPFGRYNHEVIRAAISRGYERIMTSNIGRVRVGKGSNLFPRLPMTSDIDLSDFRRLLTCGYPRLLWRRIRKRLGHRGNNVRQAIDRAKIAL